MTEASIQLSIRAMLRREFPGAFCWKATERFHSGIPDILGSFLGRFFALEVKRPGCAPTAIQAWTIGELRKAGACVFVVSSAAEARAAMRRIEDEESYFVNHKKEGMVRWRREKT